MALWTPANLATAPSAWFDAQNVSSITESGGKVSQWNDQSGSGNHATAQAGQEPDYSAVDAVMNNHPTIGNPDNSGNEGLDVPSITYQEVYCSLYFKTGAETVFDSFSTGRDAVLAGSGTNGALGIFGSEATADWLTFDNFNTSTFKNGNTSSSNVALPMPASIFKFANAAPVVDAPSILYNAQASGRSWPGGCGEMVFVSAALSQDESDKMEGYLAWKWGTQASLPSDHPYKSGPPTVSPNPLWTPADLATGPQVWWDALDAATITESGGLLSQWNDKSGNNNHATAAVGEEPTYATSHIHLDGTNRFMSFASRLFDSLHAVIFAEWDDTTGDNRVIMGDSSTSNWHGDSVANGGLFSAAFGAATFVNGTNHINGTLTAGALARYTTTTSHVLQPDGAVTTGQIGRDRGFTSRTMKGKIFEILLFDYALSQDEREKLEGYGMHRHGAASSLYVGHPYRNAPPTTGGGEDAGQTVARQLSQPIARSLSAGLAQ